MENLPNIYEKIKPSVVAVASKVSPQPHYPPIIGTGFVAREDGLIFTCGHVINAIAKLPRAQDQPDDEWPAMVLFYHNVPDEGLYTIPMDIRGVLQIGKSEHKGIYYGQAVPDMGIILVDYAGLPAVELGGESKLREGEQVAVSGFPMGEQTLLAPGWLHQITPTLQTGIVSAVLPFPCKAPHAFLIDVMVKGGSSGSPVFDPVTGHVSGMVFAKLQEHKEIRISDGKVEYYDSTSLSLVLPSRFLSRALAAPEMTKESLRAKRGELKDMSKRIAEAKERKEFGLLLPRESPFKIRIDVKSP